MPISSGMTGQRSPPYAGSDKAAAVATKAALTAAYRMGTPFHVADAREDSNERTAAKAASNDGLVLVRPIAFDDLGGAFFQQIEPDRATELAGPVCRTTPRRLDEVVTGLIQYRSGERHPATID